VLEIPAQNGQDALCRFAGFFHHRSDANTQVLRARVRTDDAVAQLGL
jgi:hypothetical protein